MNERWLVGVNAHREEHYLHKVQPIRMESHTFTHTCNPSMCLPRWFFVGTCLNHKSTSFHYLKQDGQPFQGDRSHKQCDLFPVAGTHSNRRVQSCTSCHQPIRLMLQFSKHLMIYINSSHAIDPSFTPHKNSYGCVSGWGVDGARRFGLSSCGALGDLMRRARAVPGGCFDRESHLAYPVMYEKGEDGHGVVDGEVAVGAEPQGTRPGN